MRTKLLRLFQAIRVLVVREGTDGSNPAPSSGESTDHRFLGGGAASAVCHEPAPLYAKAAANDARNRPVLSRALVWEGWYREMSPYPDLGIFSPSAALGLV